MSASVLRYKFIILYRGSSIGDTSACVYACNDQSQIALTKDGLNFCRSFDYYVDIMSDQIIELGSRQYPFKDLHSVFVELVNHHSNTYNLSR